MIVRRVVKIQAFFPKIKNFFPKNSRNFVQNSIFWKLKDLLLPEKQPKNNPGLDTCMWHTSTGKHVPKRDLSRKIRPGDGNEYLSA